MKFPRDNEWQAYIKNGHEFPIINFWNYMGKPYDHFWSTGFGSFLPDRIYHTHISKRERYVWYEDGYRNDLHSNSVYITGWGIFEFLNFLGVFKGLTVIRQKVHLNQSSALIPILFLNRMVF